MLQSYIKILLGVINTFSYSGTEAKYLTSLSEKNVNVWNILIKKAKDIWTNFFFSCSFALLLLGSSMEPGDTSINY